MYKAILVFCLALAVAQAENDRSDDYIRMNQLQYKKIVDDYDRELAFFEENFNGRVEAGAEHSKLIAIAVVENEKRLNPLLLLGDYFKKCVIKYKSALPSVLVTKKTIAACELEASKQLTVLLSAARSTRNALQKYIEENYNEELKGCAEEYKPSSANYTLCVTSVTALANTFTTFNQKNFAAQLEAAVCTAKAHIKNYLDCNFTEQSRVISLISEIKLLINKCLEGTDECKPCEDYTCSDKYDVYVNTTAETVANPFFGRELHKGCVMLNAI